MAKAKKFVLIDAYSIIYRAYYAFIKNPLKNSRGVNTSGIFGFMNTLDKIKKRLPTDCLGLAFDAPGETFRDREFKAYKATRPPTPADIPFQIEKTKEIARSLGIPQFEAEGFEADDVLATLVQKLKKKGEVYVVSSDKDLLQLVADDVYIYDAYRDLVYDRAQVIEKFGVPPERIPEYLALTGDSIDNVPGVPGVGPKRALEILNQYENFEEAITRDKRLSAHKEKARLSRRLVTLVCDIPIEVAPADLEVKKPDLDKLMPILLDLEFHSYIKEFSTSRQTAVEIEAIDDPAAIKVETAIGLAADETQQIFIGTGADKVYKIKARDAEKFLTTAKFPKAGYQLKDLIKRIHLASPLFDCAVAAWLIDPTRRSYGLEDIALQYLNVYSGITPASIASLAAKLYPILSRELEACRANNLYYTIEEPLIAVLAIMEERGVEIDIPYLRELGEETGKELARIEKKIFKIAGQQFNINSPKQLARILFEDLGLKPTKRGKTHYSTDLEVLQQLAGRHPLPQQILEYRELAKLRSTYIDPLIDAARERRVHTTFNQTGTSTGRLSSSNPNLQNIPIRSRVGRMIRKAFIAKDGYRLVSADYSQIELRFLAHVTKDNNLIEAFKQGKDIHRHTASLVFNIPEGEVDENQRRMAKVVNYGLIYGMSDYGLAQGLDIPQEEAVQFIETYYNLYPGVARWRDEAIATAEAKGYTETIFGRRRPLPDIHSKNRTLREFSRRVAINAPIQGTAADLIKLAMIEVEKRFTAERFKSGLILSIHDELLFEIETPRIEKARAIIKEVMEKVVELAVPVEISIGTGMNWHEAH
jgi:DNA polymerase-1